MLYVVTNLGLAKDEVTYYHIIKCCFMNNVEAVVIREKELSSSELNKLCMKICEMRGISKTKVIMDCKSELNMEYAMKYRFDGIQMSYDNFIKQLKKVEKNQWCCDKKIMVGVSVHNTKEAVAALEKNADYITIGHIFKTKCKEGLEPKGINIIKEIRKQNKEGHIVAIGGIDENNVLDVMKCGANSFAMMSKIMCNEDIEEFLNRLKYKIGVML